MLHADTKTADRDPTRRDDDPIVRGRDAGAVRSGDVDTGVAPPVELREHAAHRQRQLSGARRELARSDVNGAVVEALHGGDRAARDEDELADREVLRLEVQAVVDLDGALPDLEARGHGGDGVALLNRVERAATRRDDEHVAGPDAVVVEVVRECDLIHVDAVLRGDAGQRLAALHGVVRDLRDVGRRDGDRAARSRAHSARCRRDARGRVLARVRCDLREEHRLIARGQL